MPLSNELLSVLKRGNFPLKASSGIKLWVELLNALESNPQKTIKEIKKAMIAFGQGGEDMLSNELTVNNVTVDTGQDDLGSFLGAAHEYLSSDHGLAKRDPVQSLIQRIRDLLITHGSVPESNVLLGTTHPEYELGTSLVANTLTCIPDPSLGVDFGSVPDQFAIGQVADPWNLLKRRAFENRGVLTQYGGKPHYVLAHLLNHNINGSGSDERNVVPFWATANTQMAQQVESFVKTLVLQGVTVQYVITCGPPVGMTKGRKNAIKSCTSQEQIDLIEIEQHLPAHLIIECRAWDCSIGNWVTIVNTTIDNYVPETVPYLT
jgi:hypothetical protein